MKNTTTAVEWLVNEANLLENNGLLHIANEISKKK